MADVLSRFRQTVGRVAEVANAVKRLHQTAITDLANLGNLARYEVPRDVVFIDEIPRNATGNLL